MNKIILFFLSALLIFNLSILGYSQDESPLAVDNPDSTNSLENITASPEEDVSLSSEPQNQEASQPEEPAEVQTQKLITKII